MLYENGAIRYISYGKAELVRQIYSALRDREWLTILPVISDEKIEINPDSFRIKYRSNYLSDDIHFIADYQITGNSDNSLTFSMEGEALTSFEKNRIGICILHPVEPCAGNKCLITHTDNRNESSEFPLYISPSQPFHDIKSMSWKIEGLKCNLSFEGDVFETEDQRNWTDASFKTYCTPLDRPFPVKVNKGERISQQIELKVEGYLPASQTDDETIKLTLDKDKFTSLPSIGICRSSRPEHLTQNEISILRKLKFDHYRVDLHLHDDDWKTIASMAVTEAEQLGYPLELALFFDEKSVEESDELMDFFSGKQVKTTHLIIYDKLSPSTPDKLTDTITPVLRKAFPGAMIAYGTNANFAQLNRNRPHSVHNDFFCYSIHPQEHASDNSTLVENLKGQEYTVASCKSFSSGKGILISPVNIQRRFNANISNFEIPYPGSGMPPQVDSRQMSHFGACWTAGSLKYLIESGAEGITFFETVGERGIIQGDHSSKWPDSFMAARGMIFPLFYVFQFILKNKSFKVIGSLSSHPLLADSLILYSGSHIKIILINFSSVQQKLSIKWVSGDFKLKQLNRVSLTDPVSDITRGETGSRKKISSIDPITVEPFAVNLIEGSFYRT
jgi:hypothetical protein